MALGIYLARDMWLTWLYKPYLNAMEGFQCIMF